MQTAVGALKLLVCWAAGAGEVDLGAAARASTRIATWICAPLLHVAHVGLHHVQAELVHHLAQFLHAFFIGGDLRLQVGQVLSRVA
jgi:hypothetical protein